MSLNMICGVSIKRLYSHLFTFREVLNIIGDSTQKLQENMIYYFKKKKKL
jgi:hypothetical protein